MRTRYYTYKFANGKQGFFTPKEAHQYSLDNNTAIVKDGYHVSRTTRRRTKDSFREGYHPALGQYVSCPGQYRRLLKEKGLVEMGHEKLDHSGPPVKENPFDANTIKDLKSEGAEISDREADVLVDGKDFD